MILGPSTDGMGSDEAIEKLHKNRNKKVQKEKEWKCP
jgi:hypothetical protein